MKPRDTQILEHIIDYCTDIDETLEEYGDSFLSERFDYTKWHQEFSDCTGPEEFETLVQKANEETPYRGNPSTIF